MAHATLDALHYQQTSSVQFSLAHEALTLHSILPDEKILDVGCGDGKLTKAMADQIPAGTVHGIDPSQTMLTLAKSSFSQPNLTFAEGAAETLRAHEQYTLITSFSSLHWVRGQKKALKNMVEALLPGGKLLILTFPQESPYFQLMEEVLERRGQREESACPHWVTSVQYRDLLDELPLKISHLQTTRCVATYQDKSAYSDYVKGWLPCLIPLSAPQQEELLNELAAYAQQRYGGQSGLEIPYDKIVIYGEKDAGR